MKLTTFPGTDRSTSSRKWGTAETIALIWLVLALAALAVLPIVLDTGLPVFGYIWLVVPLIALLVKRDADHIGMGAAPLGDVLKTAGIALGALMVVWLIFEPWSNVYRSLLMLALEDPDVTFTWLTRFGGVPGWLGMFLTTGLLTIFGEELFFRGWLLHVLQKRMGMWWAIALQAALFSLPQAIVALFFPPLQAVLYIFVYAWLAIGVIGGWAAARTGTIWPSLIAATLSNLILSLIILL